MEILPWFIQQVQYNHVGSYNRKVGRSESEEGDVIAEAEAERDLKMLHC